MRAVPRADSAQPCASPCPLCNRTEGITIGSRDGKTGRPLRTVECAGCGLGRIDPLPSPEALGAWYRDQYRQTYKGSTQPRLRHVLRAGRQALERWRWIQQHSGGMSAGARTLDIGASSGEFVYLMQALGMQAHGIEPHRGYAQYAAQSLGLAVSNATVHEALPTHASADLHLVTMFHVLEHLVDPVPVLCSIARTLAPGGRLLLEVPNATRPCSPHYMFFQAHTLYFSLHSVTQMVGAAGLRVVAHNGPHADNLRVLVEPASSIQRGSLLPNDALREAQRQRRWTRYMWQEVATGRPWHRLVRQWEERRSAAGFTDGCLLLNALYAPVHSAVHDHARLGTRSPVS